MRSSSPVPRTQTMCAPHIITVTFNYHFGLDLYMYMYMCKRCAFNPLAGLWNINTNGIVLCGIKLRTYGPVRMTTKYYIMLWRPIEPHNPPHPMCDRLCVGILNDFAPQSVWTLSHYAIASYKAVADREPHNRFYKDVVKIITRLCALSLSLLGPLFSLCKNSPRDDLPRDPRIAWWVQTIRSARGLRTGKKIHSDAKRTTFTHLGTERWQYRKYIWNTRQTHIIYCCVMRCD